MYAIINRKGCIIRSTYINNVHLQELTVTAKKFSSFSFTKPIKAYKKLDNGDYVVPRHWACENFILKNVCFGYVAQIPHIEFDGKLTSMQKIASKTCRQQMEKGGGVLSLATGMGKTVVALHIACKLKVKTLIVVHKEFLMNQWIERIRQFVPKARIGIVQQNKVDVDNDFVVCMLQSIAVREYGGIFEDIGCVIFDEVHVVPTPVFSQAMTKLSVPYILGLSATPERRDGLSKLINWYIGPTCFVRNWKDRLDVIVYPVKVTSNLQVPRNRDNEICFSKITSTLCSMPLRNNVIISTITNLRIEGYKVIVMTDRRTHCTILNDMLNMKNIDSAIYFGGMNNQDFNKSIQHSVLISTFPMTKEGLDLPDFDAIVLASPRSNVVQACGRILHSKTDRCPVIVDIVDDWFIGISQYMKRRFYYQNLGFTICKPTYEVPMIQGNP